MALARRIAMFSIVGGSVVAALPLSIPQALAAEVTPEAAQHAYCPDTADIIAPTDPNGDFVCEERFVEIGADVWTVPAGVTSIDILIAGGGGGGGIGGMGADSWDGAPTATVRSPQRYYAGGGGGAGEVEAHLNYDVSALTGTDIPFVVGQGGNHGALLWDIGEAGDTVAKIPGYTYPASAGHESTWNSGEFTAEGGGAGGTVGFTSDPGWSGGGGVGVGSTDAATTGSAGTTGTGHQGGNGTSTAISCADLASFYLHYTAWANTCPYSGGSLTGKSSNLTFVAGGGGGGNGGPGTAAVVGTEPDVTNCNTSYPTVVGGNGGAPAATPGGLFAVGPSTSWEFGDFDRLGAGGGGAVMSPNVGYMETGNDCLTSGTGIDDLWADGVGAQSRPDPDHLGFALGVRQAENVSPASGGAGGLITNGYDNPMVSAFGPQGGGGGFVIIRYLAFEGYPDGATVLNKGGAQSPTDGLEIPVGGGQMQVYRYNPAYQMIGSGGCTPASCVLDTHEASPHQAQFYDAYPPADPHLDGSPNLNLGNEWYLTVVDPSGTTTAIIGAIVPDPEYIPVIQDYPWDSTSTYGGSTTSDQAGGGTYTVYSDLTYSGITLHVAVSYTDFEQEANIQLTLDTPNDGNSYRVWHVMDTYLVGGDSGPGFLDTSDPAHPMVGVKKTFIDGGGQLVALRNNGLAWSGYASKYYNCPDGGFSSDSGAPCSPGGESPDSHALYRGGKLWTGAAAIDADPNTDNGIAAMWELPPDGTGSVGAIDYDLVFETIVPPGAGNVFIKGRTYLSNPQSCDNTPFHTLFAALDTTAVVVPAELTPAAAGDTVYVCPGTYLEKFTSSAAAGITIVGLDANGDPAIGDDRPVITKVFDESLVGPLVQVAGDITLKNIVIDGVTGVTDINSTDADGGAISADGDVFVYDSAINKSMARHGGAVYSTGDVWIERSTFAGNKSMLSGCDADPGCFYAGGGSADGGAIWAADGFVTVVDSTFDGNTTVGPEANGGAIQADRSDISGSSFTGNGASRYGGAVNNIGLNSGADWTTTVDDSSFDGNVAGYGGGGVSTDRAVVTGSSFDDNQGYPGGGLYAQEWADVTNSSFTGNITRGEGSYGAGIAVEGTIRHTSPLPAGTVLGAGPVTTGPHLNVWGSTFTSNAGIGGGIGTGDTPTYVESSLFTLNHGADLVEDSDGLGGGIYSGGPLQVVSSTFDRNDTDGGDGDDTGAGGAIYASKWDAPNFDAIITNSTFVGNSSGTGGAIDTALARVSYSTFVDNTSGFGGAVNFYDTFEVANSVFAGNATPGSSCSYTGGFTGLIDLGGNVADDGDCIDSGKSTIATVSDMDLGTLADNGGPTPTVAFLRPSALDQAADCTAATDVEVDQRGISRPLGGGCDAGAYEYLDLGTGPGHVYIVGRYWDGGSDYDSTDPGFGASTACDYTPYQMVGDAVLAAHAGETVHICGMVDGGGSIVQYEEPTVRVLADDLTIEGDDWDTLGAGVFSSGLKTSTTQRLIWVSPNVTSLTLRSLMFDGGSAQNGGAVYAPNAHVTFTDTDQTSAIAAAHGGAVYARSVTAQSTPAFVAAGHITTFSGNIAASGPTYEPSVSGASIYATASVVLDHVFAEFGTTSGDGGFAVGRDITADHLLVGLTTSMGVGGALATTAAGGSVTVTESAFAFNGFGPAMAPGSFVCVMFSGCPMPYGTSHGGAIAATGAGSTISVDQASFLFNTADMSGGAIYSSGASLSVTNTSFVVNGVSSVSNGGAIATSREVVTTLDHDTFYGNMGSGSAYYIEPGGAPNGSTISNSIIADVTDPADELTNVSCSDASGVMANGSNNLVTDSDCPFADGLTTAAELDLVPISLLTMFGPGGANLQLANFFGANSMFDLVVVPGPDSIAIDYIEPDAGSCSVDVDEVGNDRPQGPGCDAGAYEAPAAAAVLYVEQHNTVGGGSCDSPDFNTVTEAIAAAQPGDTIHVCTGVYREPLLVPTVADLTIEGDGPTRTIFDGEPIPGVADSRHSLIDARNASNLSISGVTFRHGHATDGGAINAGTNALNLTDVRFEDNEADGDGGAVVLGADSTFDGVQFTGNSAGGNGGAIHATGNVTVLNSSLGYNSALGGAGGAIHAPGYVITVKNSTLAGNTAEVGGSIDTSAGMGGAIYGEMIHTSFVTFYDNQADIAGAALYADNAGDLDLKASLFLHSRVGGVDGGSCAVTDGGTVTDNGANISSDNTCYDTLDASSIENADYTTIIDQTVDDPYDYWGGTTKTVLLSDGGGDTSLNPAIDFADCALDYDVAFDQRGIFRPQQEQCDSGAYEYLAPTPAVYIVGRTWDGYTEDPDSPETTDQSCTNTPYSTVQAAVTAAVDDDIVHVCAGEYLESQITWDNHRLTIEGDAAATTIIDAETLGSPLYFPGDEITLKSLTLRNGRTLFGGGIQATVVNASDTVFENNTAINGGAIYVEDNAAESLTASVSIIDCTFTNNGDSMTRYGGAIYANNGGSVRIDGGDFVGNHVEAYYNPSGEPAARPANFPIEAKDVAIDGSGGAVLAGTIDVMDSYFEGNEASTHGGALLAGTVTVKYSQLYDNHADGYDTWDGYGGAIWAFVVDVEGSTFAGNSATSAGAVGAVAETGPTTVGPTGVPSGTITIDSSTFDSNSATYGAGVYAFSGEVISTNSTYHANAASMGGGAIQSVGNMTLTENTFDSNTAGDVSVGGGTLLTGAEVFATDNIFKYDTVERYGYDGCQFDWTDPSRIHDNGGNLSSDDWCIGRAWTTDAEFDLHDLDDNGGPTQTMRLGIDSIARDYISAGEGCAEDVDQRGVSRPQFTDCDAGAYEYDLVQPTVVVTVSDSSIDSGVSDDLTATVSYSTGAPAPASVTGPTGQVQFYYCVPADLVSPATCADPANWTLIGDPVDVDPATGEAHYDGWIPPADGTYEVHAIYLGDDHYEVADTTVDGEATVVVGPQATDIMVCIDKASITYGKKLGHLDVDYCVPVGECWAAPVTPSPTGHDDWCCDSAPAGGSDVKALDEECCPTSPTGIAPTHDECTTPVGAPSATTSTDGADEGGSSSDNAPDLVYTEQGDLWVGGAPTTDGPSAPGALSGKGGLPEGYYEVEPKEIYEHYGVVPPTCTVPDYSPGTPVASSPLDIVCEGGDAGEGYQFDYSLVDEQGFEVLPAVLKIKPDEIHVTFGDPVPDYTYRVRGFKLGETPATATDWVDATCHSDYTSSAPAGSRFEIICEGASAANYTFKYEAGHLEVKKATLRIAPVNTTVKYGDAVPTDYVWALSGYKDAEFPVSVSALSGYVAPMCTSTYAKGTKAGNLDITCTGGGSTNYAFDTSAKGTLTVTKVPLTVSPKDVTVTYGASKGVAAFTLSGFVLDETAPGSGYSAPVCSAVGYTSATVAGSVLPVTCTGGSSANYSFTTSDTSSLYVDKAPLKVAPSSVSVVYGSATPSLGVAVTGWVNGQSAATATDYVAPTCALGYTATTTVGSYPIVCSGGSSANYAFDTSAAGVLTVTKAPLTVTPTAASVVYGAAKPTTAFTLGGFKNGESDSALTTLPVCTSAYAPGSSVGSYAVNCVAGSAVNYDFDVTPKSTLTVTKAPLTVTPQSTSVVYGTSKPTAAFTLNGFVLGETAPGAGYTAPVCAASTYTTSAAAGSVLPITCSGGSATNYSFTASGSASLTVTKAPLKVVPPSVSLVYGSSVPSWSPSITGWVNGQNASTATGYVAPTCSLGYSVTTMAGSYPIVCSGGSATNYSLDTSTSGVLTVTKAPITITPSSATVVYGAAKPTTTFTMSGFKNSQTSAVFTAQPTCASAYAAGSGVGSYPVTCSGAAAVNYSFTTANAAVTVTAAPLVAQAPSTAVTYGDASVTYPAATVTGFVLGQGVATPGYVAPTCTSAYVVGKAAGTTSITCSGASLANYVVTYKAGTLTINKATLTVTPASKSIAKGSAVPTYTSTITGFVSGQTALTAAGYTAPKCTSSYTTRSAAGSYAITCSSGAATNYAFKYLTATLTVY